MERSYSILCSYASLYSIVGYVFTLKKKFFHLFLVCIFEGITFKNIYDTVKFAMPFTLLYPENFIYFYLAAYSFEGIIVFSLLVICTCAYMRRVPRLKQWFLSEKKGFFGVFYKGWCLYFILFLGIKSQRHCIPTIHFKLFF